MLGKRESVVHRLVALKTLPAYQQLPRQPAAASGAATPGFLGPLPFAHWGLWASSLVCNTHAGSRIPLSVAVGSRSLWVASRGSESLPSSIGRFWGRPFACSTIARGRCTTDPQSPKGGSQWACHTRGAHPTASGRIAVTVRTQSLRDASPGSESSPSSIGRFLSRRPSLLPR